MRGGFIVFATSAAALRLGTTTLSRRQIGGAAAAALGLSAQRAAASPLDDLFLLGPARAMSAQAEPAAGPKFRRIPTQFIAADPGMRLGGASAGTGVATWGLWRDDPGPRGVWLRDYDKLVAADGRARAGWTFDKNDWWLEEHGLIMPAPEFPLAAGKYLVTGGRETTAVLTISGADSWQLDGGAKLYDVTHLPCRSARYTPAPGADGSPATARRSDFPVSPGAEMPAVAGCNKQDYAVLFVIGVEA